MSTLDKWFWACFIVVLMFGILSTVWYCVWGHKR